MCGPAPSGAQTATELQVTPETMTLGVGQRQTIFAAAYDRQGNLIQTAKFTFWSSDTLIAKVGPGGTVTGVSPGLAKVEARLQARRASLAVLITGSERGDSGRGAAPRGSVLALDPASVVLLPGESMVVTPQGLNEDGTPADIGAVSWKSLKPEIATVDSSGRVGAVAPGKSIVQAMTSKGLMATAPVEVAGAAVALSESRLVLSPEEADTLRVLVPSQGNRAVRGAVRWTSADSGIAAVDSAGVVTARRPGQTEIVAAGFGEESRAMVRVHPMPASLVVSPRQSPASLVIPVRGTRKFEAHAETADSAPIPEARIIWEIGDSAILARDAARGTIIARAPGTTTLSAHLKGFEPVVWNISVVPGLLSIDHSRVGVAPGDRVSLSARLVDDHGRAVVLTDPLNWASDKASVATVSPSGEVRAVGPGRATVTVTTAWGGKDTTVVFVMSDLVVASNRGGVPGIYQLFSSSPDSMVPILTDSAANIQAVPSPDRTRIALSSNRGGSYDLWVMDADGNNLLRLTTDSGTEGEPSWTPDGARIIYTASPKTGLPQIASIRADGTDSRALTALPGGNYSADVSPDGATVAFVSTRDGSARIYVTAINGSGQRRVTKGSDRESTPRFLPNGDLVFSTEKGGGSRLERLAAGAPRPVTVLVTDQPMLGLAVSRDGSRVAYTAGKLAQGGKGKTKIALTLHPLTGGSKPAPVTLRPGEQILSVSF